MGSVPPYVGVGVLYIEISLQRCGTPSSFIYLVIIFPFQFSRVAEMILTWISSLSLRENGGLMFYERRQEHDLRMH